VHEALLLALGSGDDAAARAEQHRLADIDRAVALEEARVVALKRKRAGIEAEQDQAKAEAVRARIAGICDQRSAAADRIDKAVKTMGREVSSLSDLDMQLLRAMQALPRPRPKLPHLPSTLIDAVSVSLATDGHCPWLLRHPTEAVTYADGKRIRDITAKINRAAVSAASGNPDLHAADDDADAAPEAAAA
jgi:hypothetical protein